MASIGEVSDSSQGQITGVAIIRNDFGLITCAQDMSVRVWLKRSNGQYWPSVCHFLSSPCTSLYINHQSRHVFIGTEMGTIQEYILSEDLNVLESVRLYTAHQGAVVDVLYSLERSWLLSISSDSTFSWSDSSSGVKMGFFKTPSVPKVFQFDYESCFIFAGDDEGQITILRIRAENHCQTVRTLSGHSGAITALLWNPSSQVLYSTSQDKNIICWDIGGRQGKFIELHAHEDIPVALETAKNRLISVGSSGKVISWDLTKERLETAKWLQSDSCQVCGEPFFWNLRQMWKDKKMGVRQHHCRACGKALCDQCSNNRTIMPKNGFEIVPVRTCAQCAQNIPEAHKTPTVTHFDLNRTLTKAVVDLNVLRLAVTNKNKSISLFDISEKVKF